MKLRLNLLVAVALATAAFSSSAWAGNGQSLLQYVPANSAVVFNIDLDQVRSLPLYQMIWGMATADPEVQGMLTEIQTATGFDPNRDLGSVVFAIPGGEDERFAVLIEGTFDPTRIATFLATMPATEMASDTYGTYTRYHNPSETGSDKPFFSFVGANIVAFGTEAELNAVLDIAAGTGANVTTNATLNNVISLTDMSGLFWFAMTVTPEMAAQMADSPVAGMTSARGGASYNAGLNANYTVGCADATAATNLATFLNDQIAQARTSPELTAMGLGAVLDGVTIAASGTDVTIAATIPEATINQIIGIMTALMQSEMPQ
jgi:hypothetical protein